MRVEVSLSSRVSGLLQLLHSTYLRRHPDLISSASSACWCQPNLLLLHPPQSRLVQTSGAQTDHMPARPGAEQNRTISQSFTHDLWTSFTYMHTMPAPNPRCQIVDVCALVGTAPEATRTPWATSDPSSHI